MSSWPIAKYFYTTSFFLLLAYRVRGHWVQKAMMRRDCNVCQADSSPVEGGVGGIHFGDLAT